MNDDELLAVLASALEAPAAEPSYASLIALRRAVTAPPAPRRVRRWAKRLAASGIAVATVGASGSVAMAATNTPLPTPLRRVAHAIGLPVDSVAVATTRRDTAHLDNTLRRDDPAETAHAAQTVRNDLTQLSPSERHDVGGAPARALERADEQQPRQAETSEPTTTEGPTTTEVHHDNESPSGADHEGGQGSNGGGQGSNRGGQDSNRGGRGDQGQHSSHQH